ncbi:MAG: hypothetical protein LJE68_08180 [Rhodobacter sp.]|nr:hypothetical protein [Rhodobacter sp.]
MRMAAMQNRRSQAAVDRPIFVSTRQTLPDNGVKKMQNYNFHGINLAKIERDARKMRAEVVANGVNRAYMWVKSLFSTQSRGVRHPA